MAKNVPKRKLTLAKAFPYILVIAGLIGIICSLFLVYDQIKIWENPNYQPACSLNPIISCGSVINSKQGDIVGVPAPFFGLLVFPVLVTVGVALWAGAKFKRWFWLGLEAGAIGGFLFAIWLFLLSVFRVHALCPFCLSVDVAVYTLVWYITLYNVDQGIIRPKKTRRLAAFARQHHLDILVFWFVLIAAFILQHFWYYYGKYF